MCHKVLALVHRRKACGRPYACGDGFGEKAQSCFVTGFIEQYYFHSTHACRPRIVKSDG